MSHECREVQNLVSENLEVIIIREWLYTNSPDEYLNCRVAKFLCLSLNRRVLSDIHIFDTVDRQVFYIICNKRCSSPRKIESSKCCQKSVEYLDKLVTVYSESKFSDRSMLEIMVVPKNVITTWLLS